ncbi:SAM-dependent methyltransferase [Streptomyces sp. NPDC052236]|uniref:SAM-dependent methyltransferase n=1 Tax=Streptomyces sp. NPDC052236 TaxID=3365686 RepID=UPI0037CF83E6
MTDGIPAEITEITEIDETRPSIARVYDAVVGGDVGRYNRAVLGRGVRHMAQAGIRQFLDLGSGLPTVQNTHQVAQAAAPDSHVVYVDIDPIVLAHGRELLAGDDRATVITRIYATPGPYWNTPR